MTNSTSHTWLDTFMDPKEPPEKKKKKPYTLSTMNKEESIQP